MKKKTLISIGIIVPILMGVFAYMQMKKIARFPREQKIILETSSASEAPSIDRNQAINSSVQISQKSNGEELAFDGLPDVKVVKNHLDDNYAYDFTYQGKLFGHIDLLGDWYIDHFLSYGNGDELFGFLINSSGGGKRYWGPAIIYKVNTEQGSLEKLIDLSLNAETISGHEANSNSWGTDFFVTDVSENADKVVYCNYWKDTNTLFLKDILSNQTKEFKIPQNLSDFGDGMLSEDNSKIAFAGIINGSGGSFFEADIFILDVASGNISTYQTNKNSGYYTINGWNGDNVDYEYTPE